MLQKIRRESDNLIEIAGLRDVTAAAGVYLNAATSSFQVYASDQTTSISGPTSMGYVASSNGIYRGVLQDSVVFAADQMVFVKIIADAGANLKRVWWLPAQAIQDEGGTP